MLIAVVGCCKWVPIRAGAVLQYRPGQAAQTPPLTSQGHPPGPAAACVRCVHAATSCSTCMRRRAVLPVKSPSWPHAGDFQAAACCGAAAGRGPLPTLSSCRFPQCRAACLTQPVIYHHLLQHAIHRVHTHTLHHSYGNETPAGWLGAHSKGRGSHVLAAAVLQPGSTGGTQLGLHTAG